VTTFPVAGTYQSGATIGAPRSGGRSHEGWDIMAEAGTTIVAPVGGTIVGSFDGGELGGTVVRIQGDDGRYYYLAHLQNVAPGLRPGDRVEEGRIVGFVGTTGNAAGGPAHLHIQVGEGPNHSWIDPHAFFTGATPAAVSDSPGGNVAGSDTLQTPATAAPTPQLPPGGYLVRVDGVLVVAYDLPSGGSMYYDFSAPGAEASVGWQHLGWAMAPALTSAEFSNIPNMIHGGMVAELSDVGDLGGKTYGQWVEDQVMILLGGDTAAAQDPEIRRLMLQAVSEEWSEQEIQARIHQTQYWQGHTDAERRWTGSSQAEQQQQVDDQASRLANTWFQMTGQQIALDDPHLINWASNIAAGVITEQMAVEQWVKSAAMNIEGSPWRRQVEGAQIDARQQGVDIENKAQEIMTLSQQWGTPVTLQEAQRLAGQVVLNEMSDADITQQFEERSAGLYPNRPPGVRTDTWAAPYMSEYQRVLETSAPELDNGDLQTALQQGMTLFQFGQHLRTNRQSEWLDTQNARDGLVQSVSAAGGLMGYVA
jgi:hypothetical protein